MNYFDIIKKYFMLETLKVVNYLEYFNDPEAF